MASYLLLNDLDSAKHLWKRIPGSVRGRDADLVSLGIVLSELWRRNFTAVHRRVAEGKFSGDVARLMAVFVGVLRARMVELVARGYSSIAADDFAALVGLPRDAALAEAVRLGWGADATTGIIRPKQPTAPAAKALTSEANIRALCDYVVHLDAQ
jgi:COP9 signalosome complex subunit 8